MAIKTTRWRPDTCACIVEFTWDDTSSEDNRAHTFDRAVSICPEHQGIPDTDVYEALLAENQAKNRTLGAIMTAYARLTMTAIQPDGSMQTIWKPGSAPTWRLVGTQRTRRVEIAIRGLTALEKAQMQALADSDSPGRIVVI